MDKVERTYNVPLRKEWLKAPTHKRAKKAVTALREFLARTMRVDLKNVKIGTRANLFIWRHGMQKPPHHLKVHVVKEDGMVKAELEGITYEDYKPAPKKEEKKPGIAGKIQELKEAAGGKEEKPAKEHEHKHAEEKKAESKPEPKKEAAKEPAKEHKAEHKHEEPKTAKKSSKK